MLLTREPGGTAGAEALRALLLAGTVGWSAAGEAFVHFAARADHVALALRPALARGAWVVCDRFSDSTMAYQADGQGADPALIAGLAALVGLAPDLTLVLDVPPAVAAARLAGRGQTADRYEREDAAFQARVRQGFLRIAAAEPGRCAVLDATADTATVADALWAVVASRLKGGR